MDGIRFDLTRECYCYHKRDGFGHDCDYQHIYQKDCPECFGTGQIPNDLGNEIKDFVERYCFKDQQK